jgi:hypothetical protein
MGETAVTVKLFSTTQQNLVPWVTRHPIFVFPLLRQNVGKSKLQIKTWQNSTKTGLIAPAVKGIRHKDRGATENSDRVAQTSTMTTYLPITL